MKTEIHLCQNVQVHAAGAYDIDFKIDPAARSRATLGSSGLSSNPVAGTFT